MKDLAPMIFRKRLLIEGYYSVPVDEAIIKEFFTSITTELSLRTYGAPIVHTTSGQGKESNQGFDAFNPLLDSGIYMAAWTNQNFLSLIIYTCKDFEDKKAVLVTRNFFEMIKIVHKVF